MTVAILFFFSFFFRDANSVHVIVTAGGPALWKPRLNLTFANPFNSLPRVRGDSTRGAAGRRGGDGKESRRREAGCWAIFSRPPALLSLLSFSYRSENTSLWPAIRVYRRKGAIAHCPKEIRIAFPCSRYHILRPNTDINCCYLLPLVTAFYLLYFLKLWFVYRTRYPKD